MVNFFALTGLLIVGIFLYKSIYGNPKLKSSKYVDDLIVSSSNPLNELKKMYKKKRFSS